MESIGPLTQPVSVCSDPDLLSLVEKIQGEGLSSSLDRLDLMIDRQHCSPAFIEQAMRSMRLLGLVVDRETVDRDRFFYVLKRPRFYRDVEQERARLGIWGKNPDAPRYSVCVCNYNMSDTLDCAMSSVADQLDPKLFEILVIDDGSSDDSLIVLQKLAEKYPHFRYISLPRDPARRLGETRNISIRAARGEYVLIHIDADDQWQPFLNDLVALFHRLEAAVGHDFLFVGPQTGIAKRDFLLSFGPYANIYRCEDRNMMMKLARRNLLVFMDYRVFRTRLPRPRKKKLIKIIRDMCSSMLFEFRQNEKEPGHVLRTLLAPFVGGAFSFNSRLLRAILVLPIYGISKFYPPVVNDMTWQELRDFHNKNRGSYAELMLRFGGDPDLSFLTKEAQTIFTYNVKHTGFYTPE